MLIFGRKSYGGPRPPPLAYSLYAFINVDNCERPLRQLVNANIMLDNGQSILSEFLIVEGDATPLPGKATAERDWVFYEYVSCCVMAYMQKIYCTAVGVFFLC